MKTLLSIAIAAVAIVAMAACSNKQTTAVEQTTPKALVLYYSQSGTTQTVAQELSNLLGADIEAIEVEQPYDGSYDETIQRCMKEMQEQTTPKVKPIKANLADYDVIYLGYPIWFGTYARPIAGLVADYDFDGKTIVPFCTFGSGGLEASAADLEKALPKADIKEGYGVRTARVNAAPEELEYFLITNGYIEGEAEALPEYSEQQPVTEEETAIFDAACGNYQFPLGTPVTVGKRATAAGTDYKYTVNSKDMQGNDVTSTIYVTVANTEDAQPEFTRVVR